VALRGLVIASLLTVVFASIGVPRAEAAPNDVAALAMPMTTGGSVIPPGGVIGFCVKNLGECKAVAQPSAVVELTPDRRRDLEDVQALVNARVRPRENPRHAWEYASAGYGDCNTYALEKRRELLARGWPQTALLLASAVTETNEGHLVLITRTSAGDLVLDNRLAPVVDWGRLPYRWVSRQSEQRLTIWLSILPRPVYTSANATGKVGG
jgi:predicted transglutaminase-like cysteine proteinase